MSARAGVIYLVGAGPGDPGLMTARALELVASADVILHDRLIPAEALAGAREDAELLYVGKEPGDASVPQDEIEDLLVDRAKQGRSVVRLKGGDPFIFGRGAEEARSAAEAGIPFEIVPGVTAGVAAPAYAGIPVTHRDDASAVAFITGHEDPSKPETALDYAALAAFPGTLVFYMGVKALPRIAERLIAEGRDAAEPAAVVERGTLPGQRVVTGTLESIADEAAKAEIVPPALTVVGPVAARRDEIAWLESRPLHGRRIVVTRARAQASGLAKRLRDLGAEVVELPAIRIEPLIDSRGGRPGRRVPPHLRPRLPDEPERGSPPLRGDGRPGPRRPRAHPRPGRGDRPGHRARARVLMGSRPTSSPSASSPRLSSSLSPSCPSRTSRS